MKEITKEQFEEWKDNAVTRLLFSILEEKGNEIENAYMSHLKRGVLSSDTYSINALKSLSDEQFNVYVAVLKTIGELESFTCEHMNDYVLRINSKKAGHHNILNNYLSEIITYE